jgi:hypothetical protein
MTGRRKSKMDNATTSRAGAAVDRCSYGITPRAPHIGGGWRLQLFEGAFEAGRGVYPISDDVSSDDAYLDALNDADAWLLSRGVASVAQASARVSAALTDDDITTIWQTMPGGPAGWLKSFGFLQFARAVEEWLRENPAPARALTAAEVRAICMIQPMPVERDKDGWWSHPGIPNFDEDYKSFNGWVKALGLEATYKALQSEDDTHPVYISYFALEEPSFAAWEPTPPVGEGWFTFSIHDTEDGPVWVWARRIISPAAAQSVAQLSGQGEGGDLRAISNFLMGEAPLEGVEFGDRHPTKAGAFWWRHNLRAVLHAAGLRPARKDQG